MRRVMRPVLAGLVLAGCSSDGGSGPVERCNVRGVVMAQAQFAMVVGQSITATASIDQAGCANLPALEWSSSDPAIVRATPAGVLTAIGVGNTTITAKLQGRSDQASATVTVAGRVLGLTLTPSTARLSVGAAQQLTPTLNVDPGTPTALQWRTSDALKATVSASGLVTGVSAGEATITVISTADTTKRATATVTVDPRVLGVTVTPARDTLFVSGTRQLAASVQGDSGIATEVSWRSSSPAVATVTTTGLVTAIGAGRAEITAESKADPTRQAVAVIVVLPRVLGIAVTPPASSINVAGVVDLVATVTGDAGASTAVTWSTTAAQFATVSATGSVTGVSPGTATITARSVSDPTISGSATVTVRPRVLSVVVTPANATINISNSLGFTATVSGDPGAATTVTWSTGNAAVATVSTNGIVTGVAAGSTSITATSTVDSTRRGSATITVSPPSTPQLPQVSSLCFATPSTDPGGQRVSPRLTTRALVGELSCAAPSQLDLVAGQSTVLFGLVNGVPATVAWQLPGSSPIASFSGDGDGLDVTGLAPGSLTIGVAAGGMTASVVVRVLPSTPGSFCMSASPGGACQVNASLKVGQSLTLHGSAGSQAAAALWRIDVPAQIVPAHIGTRMTFTPPNPGTYLAIAESTAGAGSALVVITVTP